MKKINSLKMIREIRDKHYKELKGKSPQEIIDFYRKKSKKLIKS